MVKWKYLIGGIACFLAAILVYSYPAMAVDTHTVNGSVAVDGNNTALVMGGNTDLKIISTFSGNPIRPALMESTNIIYNDVDFYLYSAEPAEYEISIYENSFEDPQIITGEVEFVEMKNVLFPEDVKKIKKLIVIIGSDKYEFEDVRIMHQGIDEDKIYEDPEEVVNKREMWLKTIQSFVAGVLAAIAFSFLFWRFWKHHLETNVQDVI